ncbi:hypothetical protein IJS18_03110 [Candidatus Saccharibacteria bacterium]|nr:hypothetical protein [Candidatus Saccharibacteria bacterium]
MHNAGKKSSSETLKDIAWSLITLVPFGWIFFATSFSNKAKAAEKNEISREYALTTINNYMTGFILLTVLLWIFIVTYNTNNKNGSFIYQNIIADIVVAICYFVQKTKIENIIPDVEIKRIKSPDGDKILRMSDYNKEINDTMAELEAISPNDHNEMLEIKRRIDRVFAEYKNESFPNGGKYKIYKLKSEYYFLNGQKEMAEKFINQAAKIQADEKKLLKEKEKTENNSDNNLKEGGAEYEDDDI